MSNLNTNVRIGISYGIISAEIKQQIEEHGLKYDKKTIERCEEYRQAINTLQFGSGLLTDSMASKLIQKLHNKIISHLAKENKMSVVK